MLTVALGIAILAGGCASTGPGGKSLPVGESCGSVRTKLNRLDSRGVPSLVEAQSRGKKLAGQQKADADAYNELLNQYLGARCHEAPKSAALSQPGPA
ncbi:MAG: hypothetical protein ACT4N2_04355 [Hyphomicrobium sp.]